MRSLSFLLPIAALVSACAVAPPPAPERPVALLADRLFAAPTEPISTADVLAMSDEMRRYLAVDIASQLRTKGAQAGLIEALYRRAQLKLDYDAATTKTAAEAFAARSGNCLSLVIMTAAFAHELKLPVRYQSAYLEETWSRDGSLLFASGHVNITLGRRIIDAGTTRDLSPLTIDFLPPEDIRSMRVRDISEQTVLAMYANNRAAEALARGQLNNAYAWAAEALRNDPIDRVLAQETKNTRAMSNLAETYTRQGRSGEAEATRTRLAAIESVAPFHFFNLGLEAARQSDWVAARDFFAREVERADYYHEFHFWLGLADWQLGDVAQAREHLRLAMDNSTTRGQHDLYAAKLDWLKAHQKEREAARPAGS